MTRNMGSLDRALRAALGLGLLWLAVAGPTAAWGWLGLAPLGSALLGYCPLYAALGLDTGAQRG